MLSHILNGLSAAGNLMDLPGSSVRDALAWKNPFDQYLTPLSDANRTSGRDLLRHHGLASKEDTWGNFATGMLAETLLDPTNLIGGKAILNTMKARNVAKTANAGIKAANAKSLTQRAAGYMPEEIVSHLHPSLRGVDGATPKRMYHGTPHAFEKYDLSRDSGENLFGKGVYTTDHPLIASDYAARLGDLGVADNALTTLQRHAATVPPTDGELLASIHRGVGYLNGTNSPSADVLSHHMSHVPQRILEDILVERPQNVKTHYLDVRNPFDADRRYKVSDLPGVQGKPTYGETLAREATDARDEMRGLIKMAKAKRASGEPLASFEKYDLMDAFSRRNTPHTVRGEDYLRHIDDQAGNPDAIPEVLQRLGFDGIVHTGGLHMGQKSKGINHKVAIAFDPSQVYKPYIARKLQQEARLPSLRPAAAAAGVGVAHNMLARNRQLRPPRPQRDLRSPTNSQLYVQVQ